MDLIEKITLAGGPIAGPSNGPRSIDCQRRTCRYWVRPSRCGRNILVTGDRRHFGPLFGQKIGSVEILPPLAALERLLGDFQRRK